MNPDNTSDQIDLSQAQPVHEHSHRSFKWLWIILVVILTTSFSVFLYTKKPLSNYFNSEKEKASTPSANIHEEKTEPFKRKREVIGFLPYWNVNEQEKINTDHLTQLIYFGLTVNDDGTLVKKTEKGEQTFEWKQLNSESFKKIRKDAEKKNVKILVAVKNFEGVKINRLISNPKATDTFIKELNTLIKEQNLDGINLDFEYFSYSDFPTMQYLNPFLMKLNTELKKENPELILSFDANAGAVITDKAYDMVKIGESVDQVILMAYDYRRATSTKAGHIAPLKGLNKVEHSVTYSLDSLLGRVPENKIILAVPFYGYEWQTLTSEYESETVPNTGASATYARVKTLIENRTDVKQYWDEEAQSPWLVYKQNGQIKQIYYENELSMNKKIDLIINKKLGGVAIWAVGFEGENEGPWIVVDKLKKLP